MQVSHGFDHGVAQMLDVIGHEVGQARIFGMRPDRFDRIEYRGVSRQPFDMQPRGTEWRNSRTAARWTFSRSMTTINGRRSWRCNPRR